jgi:hypothetical protein
MVTFRGLSTGGSFGRCQAVLNWVEDNWQHFDSWCCSKNIDPIELPAYRFYNLALMAIKENRSEEQLEYLGQQLSTCDSVPHPLLNLTRITKIGLNKQVMEETKTNVKQRYIPPWYLGEEKAFENARLAQQGISTLPKMG